MFTNEAEGRDGPGRPSSIQRGATDLSLTALVEGCRQGDKTAWNAIVDRFERLVLSVALADGLTREQASDATQETFEALVRSLNQLRDPERLGSWLVTVVHRTSWRIRNHSRAVASQDPEPIPVDDIVDRLADSLWVYESVERLHEPCRTLVRALFLQPNEPSYGDVAVQIGRPVGSIGPMRARCLGRLREILEAHDH